MNVFNKALSVIDYAFERGAGVMVPLFSGGHDSLTATYIASKHPKFTGDIFHIKTGIGAKATLTFVEDVCDEYGWKLHIFTSPSTYEDFIRERGFPGPGRHQWIYNRLKDRCIDAILRNYKKKIKVALITGCRQQESERRMGHVEPLKFESRRARRYWVAPCYDWTSEDQIDFMNRNDLPRNPIKQTPLGMSGECFCGAFARPNEIQMLRRYAPDVASEIDRLTVIAHQLDKHSTWGTRPNKRKGVVIAKSGPMCNSCDARAMAAGLIIDQRED